MPLFNNDHASFHLKDVIILSSDEEDSLKPRKIRKLEGTNEHDPIHLSNDSLDVLDLDQEIEKFKTIYLQQEKSMEFDVMDTNDVMDMDPPTIVKTKITNDTTPLYTLRNIEIYLQSLRDSLIIPNTTELDFPRPSRRSTKSTLKSDIPTSNTNAPYVPAQVWYNSTWEDWAQFDDGDVLHYPFQPDEIEIMMQLISKQQVKKKQRELVDFWQSVATNLPGRTPLDCKCFWNDYFDESYKLYHTPLIIRKLKEHSLHARHSILLRRSQYASRNTNSFKKLLWSNMTKEYTITDGSGDAITVAIYNTPMQGVRVVAGSLCDENIQYNMPGNLRLWDLETNTCKSLNGHQTNASGQDIWRTVSDVKMSRDQTLIFSASHDGSANIWRAKTGKLASTLRYHSKPINQLAVNHSAKENVLATCSNDGTATVWYISQNGKSGSGVICELDLNFYHDPQVDCIEFGHHSTDSLLFLGINNKDLEHPGYVEAYDISSGKPRMRFDSMKGSISTLAVSSSGRFIVSGNYNQFDNMTGDRFIHLHDTRHPQLVSKFYSGHPDVNIVAISPCERFVASGNADKEKSQVVIFDTRNPKRVLHILSHDQTLLDQTLISPDSSIGIGGLHWMSDSRTVVTGGGDSMVKIWSIEGSTKLLKSYSTSNCVTSLNVHEETMTIAAGVAGAQGIVHVWQP